MAGALEHSHSLRKCRGGARLRGPVEGSPSAWVPPTRPTSSGLLHSAVHQRGLLGDIPAQPHTCPLGLLHWLRLVKPFSWTSWHRSSQGRCVHETGTVPVPGCSPVGTRRKEGQVWWCWPCCAVCGSLQSPVAQTVSIPRSVVGPRTAWQDDPSSGACMVAGRCLDRLHGRASAPKCAHAVVGRGLRPLLVRPGVLRAPRWSPQSPCSFVS